MLTRRPLAIQMVADSAFLEGDHAIEATSSPMDFIAFTTLLEGGMYHLTDPSAVQFVQFRRYQAKNVGCSRPEPTISEPSVPDVTADTGEGTTIIVCSCTDMPGVVFEWWFAAKDVSCDCGEG